VGENICALTKYRQDLVVEVRDELLLKEFSGMNLGASVILFDKSQWWREPGAFSGLGYTFHILYNSIVTYHGGLRAYPLVHKNHSLTINFRGITFGRFKDLFTIPWNEVEALEVDGPQQASKRVGATLTVKLKDSQSAIFEIMENSGAAVRTKLLPITSRLIAANAAANTGTPNVTPTQLPSSAPSMADELKKLAELKAAGHLTEEEFDIQKWRLLNP